LENILRFEVNYWKLKEFHQLQLDHFLNKLQLNINKHCEHNGENLSKGQRQGIAFLSLFFYSWNILLLDECLNSIIPELRIELISALQKYYHNKVMIYVSHDRNDQSLFPFRIDLSNVN
jgi:ABC-type bacteriocin/lantibiotic exporter with double-glycine peptidase domain